MKNSTWRRHPDDNDDDGDDNVCDNKRLSSLIFAFSLYFLAINVSDFLIFNFTNQLNYVGLISGTDLYRFSID